MKKFEYAELTDRELDGRWLWFLGEEIVNSSKVDGTGEIIYDKLSFVQALNVVGNDGWQMVDGEYGDVYFVIMMREVNQSE